jgi:hypothetical protein
VGDELFHTNGRRSVMTKLTVPFRNFTNTPKTITVPLGTDKTASSNRLTQIRPFYTLQNFARTTLLNKPFHAHYVREIEGI